MWHSWIEIRRARAGCTTSLSIRTRRRSRPTTPAKTTVARTAPSRLASQTTPRRATTSRRRRRGSSVLLGTKTRAFLKNPARAAIKCPGKSLQKSSPHPSYRTKGKPSRRRRAGHPTLAARQRRATGNCAQTRKTKIFKFLVNLSDI